MTKTIALKSGGSFEVVQDDNPMDPREAYDNLGVMVCFHDRYNLGDKHEYKSADYSGWKGLREQLEKDHDIAVILPLFLMDHSGITIRTDSGLFQACDGAGWDWGQVGWIYITMEKAIENWGDWRTYVDGEAMERPLDRADWTKKVRDCLVAEVALCAQYLEGDVWGYVLRKPPCECGAPGKVDDSCWGFYGGDPSENGMLDNVNDEIREQILAAG